MSSDAPIIVGWGAVSPIGLTAAQTGLFLRATRNWVRETPFIDGWGERVSASRVAVLSPAVVGPERLARLACAAFVQALSSMNREAGGLRVGVLLALAERYANSGGTVQSPAGAVGEFVGHFRRGLPSSWAGVHVEWSASGHAGAAAALDRATRWVMGGGVDVVVVGGVDSYYEWTALEALGRQDRLLSPENLDGLLPGEAAAFVVLARENALPGAQPIARVAAVGTASEPVPLGSDEPCLAKGLTTALDRAVAPLRARRQRSNYWLTDLTHETYRVKELQIVIARFGDVVGTATTLLAPAREYGDVGAASLPLLWVLALEAWYRGYAPDRSAVTIAGSDGGARGAVLLEAV